MPKSEFTSFILVFSISDFPLEWEVMNRLHIHSFVEMLDGYANNF